MILREYGSRIGSDTLSLEAPIGSGTVVSAPPPAEAIFSPSARKELTVRSYASFLGSGSLISMRALSGGGGFVMWAHAARIRIESEARNRIVAPYLVRGTESRR